MTFVGWMISTPFAAWGSLPPEVELLSVARNVTGAVKLVAPVEPPAGDDAKVMDSVQSVPTV